VNDLDQKIIEVYGKPIVIGEGKETRYQSPLIAVLRHPDSALYDKLQWKSEWRHHSTVQMATLHVFFMVWVVLAALHIMAAFSNPMGSLIVSLIFACIVPAVEIIAGFFVFRLVRIIFGVIDVYVSVILLTFKTGKSSSEYRKLFQALAQAGQQDKASAAKLIAWLM
jgi:hypothetical protein